MPETDPPSFLVCLLQCIITSLLACRAVIVVRRAPSD